MPKPDDHRDKWIYQKHTRAKHDVLHYYLKIWTSYVSNEKYSLRVFDCFAGRGDYFESKGADAKPLDNIGSEADYPGSPQIILDAVSEHEDKFKSAECYFMEPDENNLEDLKKNIAETKTPKNVNPHIKNAKFPDDIINLIQNTGGYNGFAFFFLDPFNIKYLDYDTIARISSFTNWSGGFECFITLMTSQLIRWQDSETHQSGYETLFGIPDWKEQLRSHIPEQLQTREAEFYCKRLMENDPEYTLAYMTTEGDSRRLKYHLVFTTNAEEGLEAMKESMTRQGTNFALAYAPQRSEVSKEQTGLNQFTGGSRLSEVDLAKSYLLAQFAGKSLTFDEVVSQSIVERPYADSLRQDYRQYLIEMDNAGEVNIPERDSEDAPLPEDYEIEFPEDNGN